MTKRIAAPAFALAFAALQVAGAQADTQRVGVTSAVNPAAAGTPPGATARQLVVGDDVIFRERVITTDEGQAQILFLDQSTLMIGPNSTVMIDEFVYDPSTSKGNIAATLTQGSFRYIGGKLSKQGNATLRTPIATIGIRGSDVTVAFDPSTNQTDIVTTHGSANVQTLGGVLGLRSGFGTTFSTVDRPPSAASLTATQIAAANKIFEGQVGKSAGLIGKPLTDADVADSGLSSAVQAQGLAATEPAAGGQSGSTNFTVPFTPGNNDTPQTVVSSAPPSSSPPPPNSSPRTDQTLNGYVAGFGRPSSTGDNSGSQDIRLTNRAPTDVEIRTNPDADGVGRVHARFKFRDASGYGQTSAEFEMGDAPGAAPATQSQFISNTSFIATQNSAAGDGLAKLNGSAASVTGVVVSVPAVALGGIAGAPDDLFCTCEFVTWGVWNATFVAPSSQQSLQVPVGLWVAGKLPSVSDPSPQGEATFSGTAVGMVQNQSQSYVASGTFSNVYNFGTRKGQVSISDFDGKSFGGKVKASQDDWRSYSGYLKGSNLKGTINGSFYGNRNAAGQLQTPKETAGNFNVKKQGYSASGIFIGNR